MSLNDRRLGATPRSTLYGALAGISIVFFSASAYAQVNVDGSTCSPVIVTRTGDSAWKETLQLAAQLQALIELSVKSGITVPIKSERPTTGTVLDLTLDVSPDITTVIAKVTRDDAQLNEIRPQYPTEASKDISAYFAQGLLRQLAIDWRTCDRADVAKAPDAAAYALVRAATAADETSKERAFDLATTALAIDSNVAAGYMHLSRMLAERGEPGWAKVAEQQAQSIDSESLAYVPEIDPLEALRTNLAGAKWTKANTGLEMLTVSNPEVGVRLYAWKVDPKQLDLSVQQATTSAGESVQSLRSRSGAVFSINGGFFKEQKLPKDSTTASTTALTSDGLLAVDGALISDAWAGKRRTRGGILTLDEHRISLTPSGEFNGELGPSASAVQSKPMLIEPGGKFAMYFDDGIVSKRSAVCTQKDGSAVFVLVDGKGLTLYQLARLLSGKHSKNQFECDAALALDGAISSQASYAVDDGRVLNVPGREVPYAIIANVPNQPAEIQ